MIFKSRKKRISEECWNLDYELAKWVNEHLKVYKKEASEIVDLNFYKFHYRGKEYTQSQIIDLLIETTDFLIEDIDYFSAGIELNKAKNKMYDLLKLVHWTLWW